MAEYLVTATNPEGKTVTERVDAESADEVVRLLRGRGYGGEIVLHTDEELSASMKLEQGSTVLTLKDLPLLGSVSGILSIAGKLYRIHWYIYLACLAALIYREADGPSRGWFDGLLAFFVLSPAIFALSAQFFRGTAGQALRLFDAAAWGRWDEVLARADSVGGVILPEEIAFQKAKALAGLGRFDEALRAVEAFGDGEAMPAWLYRARLAEVCLVARRHDEAKAELEAALELATGNAGIMIELADLEVTHQRNPRRARELLSKAREHTLGDLHEPIALKVDGLIRLEEGRPHEAREVLERALQQQRALRPIIPIFGFNLDLIHAGLALAHAAEGDLAAAREHYRRARPRLLAFKEDELMARCEAAIGSPPGV